MESNPIQAEALVSQRFEIKYLVSEMRSQEIIDYLSMYMEPDTHGRIYPVTSLYLDNHAMRMYWSSEMGEMNRYKLRIRSYTDDDTPQVFAEVKRRINRVILKSRVAIHKDSVEDLLGGFGLADEMLIEPNNPKAIRDIQYYQSIQSSFNARPCTTVRYQREAYMGRNGESVRITFDRDLACLPTTAYTSTIWSADEFWRYNYSIPVIMEIKFTDHYPQWVQHMIQRFSLERTSIAKYVECVKSLQREMISVIPEQEGSIV